MGGQDMTLSDNAVIQRNSFVTIPSLPCARGGVSKADGGVVGTTLKQSLSLRIREASSLSGSARDARMGTF